MQIIVLRHGELFLKGRNRGRFERLLQDNVRRALRTVSDEVTLERGQGRLFVTCPPQHVARGVERLRRVFGISSISTAMQVPPQIEAICSTAVALLREHLSHRQPPTSFRVTARRSDKQFPVPSPDIGREVGSAIVEHLGLKVELQSPELVVGVEVGPRRSFVFVDRVPGAGGLPVGATGAVALLLSGGIDSPVAGHLMQKRGCVIHPIYFHSFPYTGEHTRDKVVQLAHRLAPVQGSIALQVVPFTEIQLAIREHCPADLAVVLYRRMMMRIASRMARARGCLALATGENLGQVASQTLENLVCIETAADMPVLRPLLTHDKAETIQLARQIGTYEVSIQPYDDCCSLFVPKHPQTRARLQTVQRIEQSLPMEELVAAAADGSEEVALDGEAW